MKKHKDITNPFALAWSMYNKGFKPHIPEKNKKAGIILGPGIPDGTGPMSGAPECQMNDDSIILIKNLDDVVPENTEVIKTKPMDDELIINDVVKESL